MPSEHFKEYQADQRPGQVCIQFRRDPRHSAMLTRTFLAWTFRQGLERCSLRPREGQIDAPFTRDAKLQVILTSREMNAGDEKMK